MTSELDRALLFVLVVGALFLSAAVLLLRRLVRRWLRGRQAAGPLTRAERVVLAMGACGILCIAYGRLVEPRWLAVTHTAVRSRKLPSGAAAIKIAHLSDIHSEPTPRLESEIIRQLAREHPDVIVFSGDSINAAESLPVFRSWLRSVSQIAPTFVVKGNWDAWYWRELPLFSDSGAVELDGSAVRLNLRGTPVWLAGVAVGHEERAAQALAQIPAEEQTIFIYHYPYPDVIPQDLTDKVDLLCAGHVHGGQIALPLYGALVTLSKYGKRYEAGLYQVGRMSMYVSRGVGMEGGSMPRVRFLSRPELAIIELRP